METQLNRRKTEWTPPKDILPLILGMGEEKLDSKEASKLELFEKSLAKEIKKEDSIEQSVTKMVKMALAAEFGPSLVVAKGAANMVTTITRAIMSDAQLRKQALIIIDRISHA